MKKTITKWLLKANDEGRVMIIPREVSKFAPINRVLDDVGFYEFEPFVGHDNKYLIAFKPEERNRVKSVILVSKIYEDETTQGIVDMTVDDKVNIDAIIKHYFNASIKFIH